MKLHLRSGRLLRSRAGVTLVEMIVTFALLGLFLAAAAGMLTAAMRLFHRAESDAAAQNVSDIVLDRIEGELAGAGVGDVVVSTTGAVADEDPSATTADGAACWRSDLADGAGMYFVDRLGAPVCLYASPYADGTGGGLILHYYALGTQSATDWTYDPGALMGYHIRSLHFTRLSDYVVRAELVLVSEKTGYTYASQRAIECFRLRQNGGASRIAAGYIPTDAYHSSLDRT